MCSLGTILPHGLLGFSYALQHSKAAVHLLDHVHCNSCLDENRWHESRETVIPRTELRDKKACTGIVNVRCHMPTLEQQINTRIALKNVLYATDFSAVACAALPYALGICRHYEGTLHVVHVIQDSDLQFQAEGVNPVTFEKICEAKSRNAMGRIGNLSPELAGTPHETYVRRGRIGEVISEIVTDQQIDLLVLGTHGREGIGKLVMGSVAEELLRQSPCPVLTVGPKAAGRVKQEFDETGKDFHPAEIELRQIVFAVDVSAESLAAASFAVSLAEEFQGKISLVYVIEESTAAPGKRIRQYLESLIPEEAAAWCRAETIVRFGSSAEKIIETASELNADLIVLGVRPASDGLFAATHFSGSVAHRVIAGATCPVLSVRRSL